MLDLSYLQEFCIPVIVGICLCVGYVIKTSFPSLDNKYIPLVLAALGLALSIWINSNINPSIILGGLFSGLSSTGLYEMFRNLLNSNKDGE